MKNTRKISLIVIHCSATRVTQDFTFEKLEACHLARGFRSNPADTRTKAQKQSLQNLLTSLCVDYPEAEILGHRDLPNVHKSCPCFSVQAWLNEIKFHI